MMILIDKIMGTSENFKMQERVLNIILFLGCIIAFLAGVTNVITRMPMLNYILPFISAVLGFVFYILSRKFNMSDIARILMIIYLDFIYMPIGWLTTAGSNSAMVYYSILFLIVTFILISNRWEYIIPFLYIILIIFLMYLETKYPDHFYIYKSSTTRFYDISVHYVINVLVLSITTIILKYKYSFEHLKYIELSNRDALTGLYNRRYITDRLRREYKKSKTENLDFCIIMIDIDNFKKVNDIYGHQAGDDVLIKLANSFIVNSRRSDICGRYGGDEFIIILPNCSESNAKQYSERVQNTFDEICKCYQDTGLSISFGISNNRLSSVHDIIKNADLKLYNNKLLKKKLSALEGEYTNEQI